MRVESDEEGVLSVTVLVTGWGWFVFFFQAEDGIRDLTVTGVQTCALPISHGARSPRAPATVPESRRTSGSRGRAASMHPSQSRHEPRVAAEAPGFPGPPESAEHFLGSSSSLGFSLAVDAERSPGIRLQPFARNLVATVEADAVRPVVDST